MPWQSPTTKLSAQDRVTTAPSRWRRSGRTPTRIGLAEASSRISEDVEAENICSIRVFTCFDAKRLFDSDIACEDYGLLLSLLAGQKSPARPLTGSPVKVSTCARTSRLPGGCPRPPTHRSRSPVPESLHRPSRATWILATAGAGIRFNEHLEFDDGETVFRHACKLGLEGIVSKRKDSSYRSGRSQHFEARRPTHQCHCRAYRASRNSASSI